MERPVWIVDRSLLDMVFGLKVLGYAYIDGLRSNMKIAVIGNVISVRKFLKQIQTDKMEDAIFTKDGNGKPCIILNPGKYQFWFGVWRAKKIIEHISEIRAHVSMYANTATFKDAYKERYNLPGMVLEKDAKYPIKLSFYKCMAVTDPKNFEAIKSFINRND